MDKPRPCGCKGRRTCLICEKTYDLHIIDEINKANVQSYVYCPYCNKAFPGWDSNGYKNHPNHTGDPLEYKGVYIKLDFLSESEENNLVKHIDNIPWDLSQSGRRKQNYGPKCNFKKRKLKLGEFQGFPSFSKFVQDRFKSVPILKNFQTIEQCSLEYDPSKGASIDPHIDDCWIWGERIVTVNLLFDSVLTMTYNQKPEKYNLDCVENYHRVLDENGLLNFTENIFKTTPYIEGAKYPVVRIPMPRRSLLVMYGSPRYDYEHRILREDIVERRVCIAYREFTPPYLENDVGKAVLERAKNFWDVKNN